MLQFGVLPGALPHHALSIGEEPRELLTRDRAVVVLIDLVEQIGDVAGLLHHRCPIRNASAIGWRGPGVVHRAAAGTISGAASVALRDGCRGRWCVGGACCAGMAWATGGAA
eukprot:CAMPEP_0117482308 /NCGR_PEP_ID=MMETSP0784-20121206/13352_1 /TAXON_ID=39447 /ORGANISM="" /LENGTH=111 /DNA_ID=CAMNT_0005276799 /DNA_START=176 /DNA_END=510 /DNA_ORIENTATION=-